MPAQGAVLRLFNCHDWQGRLLLPDVRAAWGHCCSLNVLKKVTSASQHRSCQKVKDGIHCAIIVKVTRTDVVL